MLDRTAKYCHAVGEGMLKSAPFCPQVAVDVLDLEEPYLVAELVQWLVIEGIEGATSLAIYHFGIHAVSEWSLIRLMFHPLLL